MRIRQLLIRMASKFHEKSAFVFRDQSITFSELKKRVFSLANSLRSLGVGKGDRVAIYLPNCPEYCYSYLATFVLGAVCVPLDYMLKNEEIESCLNHSEAKVLIAKPKKDINLQQIQSQVSSLKQVLIYGEDYDGKTRLEDLYHDGETDVAEIPIDDHDPSMIMYTSGTTGNPKGVLLNYQHLTATGIAMKHFVELSSEDVKLCPLPLSHMGGFMYIQNCLEFGITVVLMDRFNPFEFLQNVTQYKVTCFHIVPPMYNAILTLKQIETFDLSSLRFVVVFGAPSSPEILQRFHQYCPNARLLNGWGMTETCPPNTVTPLDSDKIESVGKPAPHCDIKIFNEQDEEVSIGELGEVVIRGWIVMDGYYKDPELTDNLKRGGWFHTGDLGRFDDEGFLYIVGRKKEMIKVGGQIVYEPEVEAAFYKHESIQEVAVLGVPDKLRGEAVKAFVVLHDGVAIKEDELRYFAKEYLAHFKVPQFIELRENLPKNRTGKIDKSLLKQEVLA